MTETRAVLRHFLATLAYRTQKAVRGAPDSFGTFQAGQRVRTPAELVRHMTMVLGYTRACFDGRVPAVEPLPDLGGEVARLHETIEDLGRHLTAGSELKRYTEEQLLQGPLSDAMTHAGQLAMLRRLAGFPVAPESFVDAAVDPANLGPRQPDAAGAVVERAEAPTANGQPESRQGGHVSHVEVVQQIYQAFGRGDVPAILEHLAENVEWEYGVNSTDVPWLQPRRGRAQVPEFFQALAAVDIQKFQPKTLVEAGDVVLVLIDLEGTVRSTGRRVVEEDEVHIWYFDSDGKVVRFRHRADTHQHWVAFTAK
jgi:ketosteroid isomerase-like protein